MYKKGGEFTEKRIDKDRPCWRLSYTMDSQASENVPDRATAVDKERAADEAISHVLVANIPSFGKVDVER